MRIESQQSHSVLIVVFGFRYTIIVVGTVGAVMYQGFNMSQTHPDIAYAVVAVCMLVAAGGALNFIMVPKILAILRGEQVDFTDLKTSHEKIRSANSAGNTKQRAGSNSSAELKPMSMDTQIVKQSSGFSSIVL